LEVGTFSPRRVRAHLPFALNFTANFNIPFFIQIGYNDPVLGEMLPLPPRTAKFPALDPGEFPVSVSYDGLNWKEIDHLIVEAIEAVEKQTIVRREDPAQVALGVAIGLGIVAILTAAGLVVWVFYEKRQRKRRQRRSDEGQFGR
jgi:hypothetical protein